MRTFLIFGSAFGPHWTQKVGIFSPIDEVCRYMQENPKVTLLTSNYGICLWSFIGRNNHFHYVWRDLISSLTMVNEWRTIQWAAGRLVKFRSTFHYGWPWQLCFVSKLTSLRSKSACLTVECCDFELSINLQLNLPGLVYLQLWPRPRLTTPHYLVLDLHLLPEATSYGPWLTQMWVPSQLGLAVGQ